MKIIQTGCQKSANMMICRKPPSTKFQVMTVSHTKNQMKSETVFVSDQKQDKVTLSFTSFKAIPLPSSRHNNPNEDMLSD
jgi:hypothetical protein